MVTSRRQANIDLWEPERLQELAGETKMVVAAKVHLDSILDAVMIAK
jgi:hypothetical protein